MGKYFIIKTSGRLSSLSIVAGLTQGIGQQSGCNVDNRYHSIVSHAGRTNNAQCTDNPAIYPIRGGHDAQVFHRHECRVTADIDLHTLGAATGI